MRSSDIKISTSGIKKALSRYKPLRSISEFVWNGFDAGATHVEIQYDKNDIGYITELRIIDNGSGMASVDIDEKFTPFLNSQKVIDPADTVHGPSAIHGKNGIGRLTFFKFARKAKWSTTCLSAPDKYQQCEIEISGDNLNSFHSGGESETLGPTGTIVRFNDVIGISAYELEPLSYHLAREFAWFLELPASQQRSIAINGELLNYEKLVGERHTFDITKNDQKFDVRFIRWQDRLHDEYSRYYFIDSKKQEKAKRHTSFNNKADSFYHSIYVESAYFDSLIDSSIPANPNDTSPEGKTLSLWERDETFKEVMTALEEYLHRKRKPFLRKQATKYVQELQEHGAFPEFSNDPWDQYRKQELEEVVREVYEADPRIFSNLNLQQRQTMVRLFHLTMNSSERDNLLDVVAHVVNLESKERADLASILHTTQLSNIVTAMKMIEDRYIAVDELKKLVFNPEFDANERENLQTHIERHYWLFGEQYHLVTAAEPDFEQALRKFTHYLTGNKTLHSVNHPDKNKEMDIFAVRWLPQTNAINNIVVELKHPSINLGSKELEQVKTYMSVILSESQFNSANMNWEFFLVGNEYNDYIAGEIQNAEQHGERHLAYKRGKCKIYVLTWSEVVANFELRHKFILDKLQSERDKLVTDKTSADDILIGGHKNSAAIL